MATHGVDADSELSGDGLIANAPGDQFKYLPLSRRQSAARPGAFGLQRVRCRWFGRMRSKHE